MSTIKNFLVEPEQEQVEVKFKRFEDPFILRSLSGTEANALEKKATRTVGDKRGAPTQQFDQTGYVELMLVESVVQPDLNNAELQEFFGAVGQPFLALKTMLRNNELTALVERVMDLNGKGGTVEELMEEAKN